MTDLTEKKIVIVGGRSGIARRIAADAVGAGADVVLAGRDPEQLRPYVERIGGDGPGSAAVARVDLSDEDSIAAMAERVGGLDHLVSVAAAHANGPIGDLDAEAVHRAFDAKVVGPFLMAKHLAARFRPGGSILLFSGLAAWRPAPGLSVTATTNGAVAFLVEALAVELGPIRVNALSPGVIDSGYWNAMGADKDAFFADTAAANPAGRVGGVADVSAAVLATLTNPFVTGSTLHVDGGGRLT